MLNFKKIEKFAQDLHESIPKIIQDFTHDLDTKIYTILHNQINRMHFVNREEFNLQTKILLKTQEKLKQIEKKIETLETQYKHEIKKYNNNNKNK